jgi:uncharacterized protein YndB with AHSA1/START domain
VDSYATRIEPNAIRLERLLPGPIERVWAFLTESEKRAKWLASGDMDLRSGGKVELNFSHEMISPEATPAKYKDMPMGFTGRIIRCEPPKLLQFAWMESHGSDSEVTWELAERGAQVLFTITHRKLEDRAALLSVSGGWDVHVGILEDVLTQRPPRGFWSSHERREQEYAARFPD